MDEKRNLKSLRPVRFHSLGSLQEKLTEEELHDFLQISSDIDISVDLETVGDYLRNLEEKENRIRDKRLTRNRDDQPSVADSFTSTNDQPDPASGYSFCTATSSEDTESVSESLNESSDKTPECDHCNADHPNEKVTTDVQSLSKADNISCNSNIPNYDTQVEMLPNKRMMYSHPVPVEKVLADEESSEKENGDSCITSIPRPVEKELLDKKSYTKEIDSSITTLPNPMENVSSDKKSSLNRNVFDKITVSNPVKKVSLDKKGFTKEDMSGITGVPSENDMDRKSCPKGNVFDKINVFSQLEKGSLDKKKSTKKEGILRNISFPSPVEEISADKKIFTKENASQNTNFVNPVVQQSSDKKSSSKVDVSDNMNDPKPVMEMLSDKKSFTKDSDMLSNPTVPNTAGVVPLETTPVTKDAGLSCNTNVPSPITDVSSENKAFITENVPRPLGEESSDKNIVTKEHVSNSTHFFNPVEKVFSDKATIPKEKVSVNTNFLTLVEEKPLDTECFSEVDNVSCIKVPSAVEVVSSNKKTFREQDDMVYNAIAPTPFQELSVAKMSTKKNDTSCNISIPDVVGEKLLDGKGSIEDKVPRDTDVSTRVDQISSDKRISAKKDDASCSTSVPDTVGEMSLDKKSCIKENMSRDTSVPTPVKEMSSVNRMSAKKEGETCATSVLCRDVSHPAVLTDTVDNTGTKSAKIQDILTVADPMDLPDGTPVTILSPCKVLKKPVSLTEMCKIKERIQALSNSDTAVSDKAKDGKLLKTYLKSKVVSNQYVDLQHSSEHKFSEEAPDMIPCSVTIGSVDVTSSNQICGQGDADFVFVDGDSLLQENEISNDTVEITECKGNDFKRLDVSGEEPEHEVKESIDKDFCTSFQIPICNKPDVIIPVELNPFVQYALQKIEKSHSHSFDAGVKTVNLPSVEYFVMPGEFLCESDETNLLDVFDTREMYKPEISEFLIPASGAASNDLIPSAFEDIAIPSCSPKPDALEKYIKTSTFTGYEYNEQRQEKENEIRSIQKHVVDACNFSFLTTLPEPGISSVYDKASSQELLDSLDQKENKLYQADKSFKRETQKDKIKQASPQSQADKSLRSEQQKDTIKLASPQSQADISLKREQEKDTIKLASPQYQSDKYFKREQQKDTIKLASPQSQADKSLKREQQKDTIKLTSPQYQADSCLQQISNEANNFNSLVQNALQQIEKSQSHYFDPDVKTVNLPSVEYFAMPGESLCESVETDLLDAFDIHNMNIPSNEASSFNMPVAELFTSSVSAIPVGIRSPLNNRQVGNNPSEIIEASDSASVTFNTASIGSSSDLDGSQEGTSTAHDDIVSQLNEVFSSFERQKKMKTALDTQQMNIPSNEANNFNMPVAELFTSSVSSIPVGIRSPINNRQVGKEPSDIIEASDSASVTFNTASIGSSSDLDGSQEVGTSTAHDNIVSQLNEVFSSFEQQKEMDKTRVPQELTSKSIEDMFNSASQASFSTSEFSIQLDDSFQDTSDLCDSIDSLVESLLHSSEQMQYDAKQNDSPSVYINATVTNMQSSLSEDVLPGVHAGRNDIENILPGKYNKQKDRTISSRKYGEPNHKDKRISPGTNRKPKIAESKVRSTGSEIEAEENDSYLSIASTDMRQSSLPNSSFQLSKSEDQNWGLEIDSDVQRYASLLQAKFTSPLYQSSYLKKKVPSINIDTAESNSDIKLHAQRYTMKIDGTSPKTDCMSLQEFFDSTKQLAFNERSWDFFDVTSGEDIRTTSSGEFRYLEKNSLEKSDFEICERNTKYQQLPLNSLKEKSTTPKSNRLSWQNHSDPRNKQQGGLKRNAQGMLCKNIKMQRPN